MASNDSSPLSNQAEGEVTRCQVKLLLVCTVERKHLHFERDWVLF